MQEPEVLRFLETAAKLLNDAIFIAQSLPNVEEFAVERAILRLQTVVSALDAVSSCVPATLLSPMVVQELHANINAVLQPLLLHTTSPPPVAQFKPPITRTGKVGRPSYSIDLDKAEELRWNGATWEDVATYFNVTSRTLFWHMKREGRPTRRPYDDISNGLLDEAVAGIVLQHPQSGAVIILGHLATLRIKVPLARVRDCLRRVDPIGVMLRYAIVLLCAHGESVF